MASSRGVQQHEVDAAADALLAERLRPTVERVRVKMGRGSPNTVAPMLETWFAGLAPRLGVVPSDGSKTVGPPADVRQAIEGVWDLALRSATGQVQATFAGEAAALVREREELAAARRDVDGQLAAAEQRHALLEQSLEQARRQVDERIGELRDARALLQQREGELERARSSIVDLVAQKDSAARVHAKQLESLAGERARLTERAATTEKRLLEEVDRARQEAKQASKLASELQSRATSQQAQFDKARETSANAIHKLEIERAQLMERLAGAGRKAAPARKVARKVTERTGSARAKRRVRS